MYHITTLPNRLKIITHALPHVHGVTSAIFIATGSRFESPQLAGISHFAEHLFFKGTLKRPTPIDISSAIEGLGGYLNAATSQDYTFFYNRVPAAHAFEALDVLADMLNNSLFDPAAIERERGVILEELNMYLDTPMRYIYDLIMQTVWPAHPLGRNVIGTPSSIKNLRRQDFMAYIESHYQPSNTVVSLAGRLNHLQLVRQVSAYFKHKTSRRPPRFIRAPLKQSRPRIVLMPKQTDQVHLALAVPAICRNHPLEHTLLVLDTILGTGMSSRLFLNIREQRGLCYSINTFDEKFAETGIFGVAAGLNTAKIDEAIRAILVELKNLATRPVTPAELDRAKEYLRGTLSLQMDNTDNLAIYYGGQALFSRKIKTIEERIKQLLQVTQNDILKLSRYLFKLSNLNLAVIGPFNSKTKAKFSKLLKNF